MPRRFALSVACAVLWLCAVLPAIAAELHGAVTFGGLPVPGATVTVKQGTKTFTTITDQGGLYHFDNVPDGSWTIEIEMQCFRTIDAQVTVDANTPAGKWELTLIPMDQLLASTKIVRNPIIAQPTMTAPPDDRRSAETAPEEIPKLPDDSREESADGLLVNGSENNAATSRYSTNPAFGNQRSGGRALYTGGFAMKLDNSATDARPYSITGIEEPKNAYDLITNSAYVGGPIRIPHLMPFGPDFFVNYAWARDNNAATVFGLVPTAAERAGNLAGLLNARGQPVTIYNPATGQPYTSNQVPVNPQAAALLALYPSPNIEEAAGYNYQAPVLNSVHQDALQSRMQKTLGRRDQLYGGFAFESTRAASVSLFDFIDRTDSLGMNANIHWTHRFNSRLFLFSGFTFSRLRTGVTPNFANRVNISGPGDANIGGNNQDPADWGPPTLGFSSGIASLSDGNSLFNRARTDAVSLSGALYRGRHNITAGGDFRKQEYNDEYQQNPRGRFTFTGAATAKGSPGPTTGSDLADFLIGTPDASAIAFGNADKYLREPVYDAYITDDWRVLSSLTIDAGMRWEYGAPIMEMHNRLANLDLNSSFSQGAPVLATNPVGPVTGMRYPAGLIRPDRSGIEPRIGIAWRPIPASTWVVRSGYGVYRDTSVYQNLVLEMAQQEPFSKSLSIENSAACPLTLANGFNACPSVTPETFAIDPYYRVGYAQTWNLSVQRDLPRALQMVAGYFGVKGTHGAQQILPNTNPLGAVNACPSCPVGFVYRMSGGNSTRQAGQVQLRRRLRSGFTASVEYTYSKSIDDDAVLGGQGYVTTTQQNQDELNAAPPSPAATIAQNWHDPRAERALSTFDQRHLVSFSAQYTTGEGIGGGTLMSGWRGRLLKEWTLLGTITAGTGMPETPIYPVAVPGTGFTTVIRPSLTGAALYRAGNGSHLNPAAFALPAPGEWGNAGRNSITGPNQFTLNSSLGRTFRPHGKTYLDLTVNATNLLNHPDFTSWNTVWNSASLTNAQQFGRPSATGGMRGLQTTVRLRF